MFGVIGNGNTPTSISELLTAHNFNYNLSDDAILKLYKVKSQKYGIQLWRYQAARLWNTIPSNLKNISMATAVLNVDSRSSTLQVYSLLFAI